MMNPVFIFSLPRSGSTLTQKILASHNYISTTSEPWLLLPILSSFDEDMCYSKFGHKLASNAIRDFYINLPSGLCDYHSEIADFVRKLYTKASSEESIYFVDKTPIYYLVVETIIEIFPDAKFIFLWRNH